MMSPAAGDLRHLVAADGYLDLGMRLEAKAELKQINREVRKVVNGVPVNLELRFKVKPAA